MKKKLTEKILAEPLSSYNSNTYNTMISVVQGVSLGGVFYIITIIDFSLINVIKCLVVIYGIALIWHRYSVHNKFITWQLKITDTLIPISFAIVQFFLALSIPKQIYLFSLIYLFYSFFGFLAYNIGLSRLKEPESLRLYLEHFKPEGPIFSKKLLNVICSFYRLSYIFMLLISISCFLITLFNYYLLYLNEDAKTYITVVFNFVIISLLYKYDLRWYLNKQTDVQLRKYNW
ncbi:MAG: hypothetical protein A2V66_16360 [Ignavibacteria bacterium RBG_13_36_8]|nr:MAG: hypothetical protein A2V66_16360 [Ignavibacteria bacterium RBG_13_36_8]